MTTTERTKLHINPDDTEFEIPADCEIGEGVWIESGVKVLNGIDHAVASAKIGDCTIIHTDVELDGYVVIGASCRIDYGAILHSQVVLGDNVFVGDEVVISFGVVIGNNSVIGRNALIDRDVILPANSAIPANSVVTNRRVIIPLPREEDQDPA